MNSPAELRVVPSGALPFADWVQRIVRGEEEKCLLHSLLWPVRNWVAHFASVQSQCVCVCVCQNMIHTV